MYQTLTFKFCIVRVCLHLSVKVNGYQANSYKLSAELTVFRKCRFLTQLRPARFERVFPRNDQGYERGMFQFSWHSRKPRDQRQKSISHPGRQSVDILSVLPSLAPQDSKWKSFEDLKISLKMNLEQGSFHMASAQLKFFAQSFEKCCIFLYYPHTY